MSTDRSQTIVLPENLRFLELRSYLVTAMVIACGFALPLLFHLFPLGGRTFLPIYFFTLIGAYRFGWRVGLATAVCAPLLNFAAMGMPPPPVLPFVLIKGALLAIAADFYARRLPFSIFNVAATVATYQLLGMGIEYLVLQDLRLAFTDLLVGYPGLLIQIFGGYGLLLVLNRYGIKTDKNTKHNADQDQDATG